MLEPISMADLDRYDRAARRHLWRGLMLACLSLVLFFFVARAPAAPPVATNATADRYGTFDSTDELRDHRSGAFSASDSLATTTPIDVMQTNANPTILVDPVFSAAGATVCVHARLYVTPTSTTWTVAGVTTITASTTLEGGVYKSDRPATFDTLGFPYADLRYEDVSSGTITARAMVTGFAPLMAR